ncbi:hypothetical protein [Luteithermobacter gelatinilyticus]|uniref:hypothetical protein n=1 Tax=Luteithermobacter gelatinilyticus TaxID=2582913 RepID=UPI001105DADF|nr:hypothetical protein [Luteithermobacter gelatinilyticus]
MQDAPGGPWGRRPLNNASARALATRATCNSRRARSSSARLMVLSSSISGTPASTHCPFSTWIALTTPSSAGWITLILPRGTILPWAVATTSTRPKIAQNSARLKKTIRLIIMMRPAGEAGRSRISSAAGRKSASATLKLFRSRAFCCRQASFQTAR